MLLSPVKIKVSKVQLSQLNLKKERVFVEGVNTVKRHTKPSQANPQGGIVTKEAGIHVSNVMIVDPETKTATRIKKVEGKDGKFVRATVKSGTVLK